MQRSNKIAGGSVTVEVAEFGCVIVKPGSEVGWQVVVLKSKEKALEEFGRAAVVTCGFPSGLQSLLHVLHLNSLIEVQQSSLDRATYDFESC